jgi:hypothetical protein
MHDIGQAFLTAVTLIRSFDPGLIGIVTCRCASACPRR